MTIVATLMGAVAMASTIATLFFAKFWRQTRDPFFLYFAFAFGIDACMRFSFGIWAITDEAEPLFYIARLVMFSLIIFAIIRKNANGRRQRRL